MPEIIPQLEPGSTAWIAPTALATDLNIRTAPNMTKAFIAGVAAKLRVPPLVYWNAAISGYQVDDGQRRVLAAVEACVPEILVVVVERPENEAERIEGQIVINGQRDSISKADEAAAYKQLALFGMPASKVAQKTGAKMDHIAAAIKVADTPGTAELVENHAVDMLQASVIAEFDGQDEIQKSLITIAETDPSQFTHRAEGFRTQIARDRKIEALVKVVTDANVLIVDRPKERWEDGVGNKHKFVADLVDKTTGQKIDAHADCPGHGAFVGVRDRWSQAEPTILYVCTDPSKNGHRLATAAVVAKSTEKEKAERRQDREDKAAWKDASTVREAWIRDELLNRAALPPRETNIFIAQHLAGELFKPHNGGQNILAASWLDATPNTFESSALRDYLIRKPNLAQTLSLAVALAAMEMVITDTKGDTRGWADNRGKIGPYLEQLAAWGYDLSPIEGKVVVADRKRTTKAAKR